MIYRYLVVSRSPKPIDLSALRGRFYHAGGIQAAILLANKQIFDEAAKILYDENYCIAVWSKWFDGIAYRVDSPKTKFTTTRSLRSGKTVDMVKYNGIVYKKIFQKLKHVELRVDIDDRIGYCDVHAMRMAAAMKSRLETLEKVLKERQRSNYAGDPSAKHWNLVINSQGILGHTVNYLEFLLSPLLIDDSAPRTLKLGKISVTIKGNWTKNWFKVFEDLRKLSGFSADDIKDVEVGPAVRLTLIEMAWDGYFDGDYRGRLLW
ncbi:hypothetical protein BJ878DRAFT_102816 [Calycina marina]|uniref:Uncharacterized protein n=1 Tax=Calycina marina TaxID=1763456 RepID=A0A9P7Z2V0_9HELO|nr:hypothetical protein BJ878DRAFT_102816 [Calycina marina]